MRLGRLGHPERELPVAIVDGRTYDLRSVTNDIDPELFELGGFDLVERAIRDGAVAEYREPFGPRSPRIGAPLSRPTALICIGMNYAEHAVESGSAPPSELVLFFAHPHTIVGSNYAVLVPPRSEKTDWKVELTVIGGRRARYLSSEAEAVTHVAGFAISNDVFERKNQLETAGGQWNKGKSSETFNPFGHRIIRATSIDHSDDLRIQSWVNGQPRQDSNTSDLIFRIGAIIQQLINVMVLEPGDVINTGTPQGVALSGRFPFLRAGDVVECEIEGPGPQRQVVENGWSDE